MPKAVRELMRNRSYDEPDRIPKNISITNLDILMYVVAIVGHLVDLGIDINIAVRYYLAGYMEAFGWTLVFILLPALVNTAVSIRMYSQDKQQDSFTNEVTKRHWLRIFILVLQMAPILRFTDALIYAIKSRRAERNNDPASQRLYYSLMLKEDSDAALLRIFECFLEAAPQLVLQITLVLQGRQQEHTVHQALSISSSLISLGWCLAAYQRAVRFAQEDKNNVTWLGSAMQTVWHYLLTLSRVISIAIIAYMYPYWTVLACGVHILVMTAWIQMFDRPIFCSQSRTSEIAFSFALGAVYLFTYILSVEAKTRYRYSVYYTVCFLQNVTCALIWFFFVKDVMRESNAFYVVLILCIVPYLFGICIMVVYYSFFHPNLRKREDTISVAFKINDEVFDVAS